MTELLLTKGQVERNQLGLPKPYFVVVDDWFGKIGEKAYILWFKLLTKVDRTDNEKNTVKYTQQSLAKALGISKPTLISQLKPLYEYGFIDYKEYVFENGNVGENIVVYEAPLNDKTNLMRPLEKIRDWEKRTEEKYDFTKRGGRPKKEAPVEVPDDILPEKATDKGEQPKGDTKEIMDSLHVMFEEDEIDLVTVREFKYFLEEMVNNGADMRVLLNWIRKNSKTVPTKDMCYIFKQLATYPEPIKKTAVFITNALKSVPTFYRPVTEQPSVEEDKTEYKRLVPFYNWLEDDK
ncbi:hypothetical protein [Bacillus amyloliquefaciens]|uniref:hypothetical protein n=1 Tax=Bacillus amyloliquefaciens TaxID=1390 RepID=UPI0006932AEC|nr:hypothetical protein [Bacillus amyloliquefaciens]